ncbi:MAG: hypothetical protein RL131_708 [Bacteroidota bacterium]
MSKTNSSLFGKDNLTWMLIGLAVMALGVVLMTGGKNTDPNLFDETLVYSKIRITVAPILIVVGLLIEVYAIMKKSK